MFLFHLALALTRTVEELLETCSYEELLEWAEYFQLNPPPEWRADARAGQICAVIANVNRDPKKQKPFSAKDFMLFQHKEEPKDKVSPETKAWFYAVARKNAH